MAGLTRRLLVGVALAGLAGCETYESPPRLLGVATDDCPDCEVLELSETRLPLGEATLAARFAYEDEWGAIEQVRVFVTRPSGEVVQEEVDATLEPTTSPGLTCGFVVDLDELVTRNTCVITALRFRESGGTLLERLRGFSGGELTARFGLELTQTGTWTVEVEATRDTGAVSNRLSETFEVADSVDPE